MNELTKREEDILKLIADGLTTKELAYKLGISFKTASTHRFDILREIAGFPRAEFLRT
jgi:DNA-binding NarL/FixJ family response regulator